MSPLLRWLAEHRRCCYARLAAQIPFEAQNCTFLADNNAEACHRPDADACREEDKQYENEWRLPFEAEEIAYYDGVAVLYCETEQYHEQGDEKHRLDDRK